MKMEEEGLKGPIAKFFQDEEGKALIEATEAVAGDLLVFVADKKSIVADSLGALRVKLGKELKLIDESKVNFLWVTGHYSNMMTWKADTMLPTIHLLCRYVRICQCLMKIRSM